MDLGPVGHVVCLPSVVGHHAAVRADNLGRGEAFASMWWHCAC